MQRETKTVTTPSGKSVVIHTYLTGREANEIKKAMYKSMKIDMSTGQPVVTDLTGEFMLEQEQKLLEKFVVSIDGKTENVLNAILDLNDSDYQAIVAEVNAVHKGNLNPGK